MKLKIFSHLLLFVCLILSVSSKAPHIILIVADDLGWNDVGFHGSNQIPTPNIDSLAYGGVILRNYYVDPICTPSRSALLTGKHPIHTGLQSGVLVGGAPYALPLSTRTFPEYLSPLGYLSHAVGKWHLGSHTHSVTPTYRGFLSHTGYWTGHEDYYDHSAQELYGPVDGWGYDFRRDMNVSWEDYGNYATDIFTQESVKIIQHHNTSNPLFLYLAHLAVHSANTYSPLQAPEDAVDRHSYIRDPARRVFGGMLYKLDESVGDVVAALAGRGMLQDSIIVFTTDNGGPAAGFDLNHASNWPLRGTKDTLWEGGVRGAGFVWSPLLKTAPRVSNQLMNIQDWVPTLYSAAGGDINSLDAMDGVDMWRVLSRGGESPRNVMLHNIDDSRSISAVRVGDWKLMRGTTYGGAWDNWYGPSGRTRDYDLDALRSSSASIGMSSIGRPLADDNTILNLRSESEIICTKSQADKPCKATQQVCLFNITADPCEFNNLAFTFPSVIKVLESTIDLYNSTAVPPGNKPIDPRANPKYFDYTWTNWCDFVDGGCAQDNQLDQDLESNDIPGNSQLWHRDIQNIVNQLI